MEKVFLKKSPSFTDKLSRAKRNFSATYDNIKSPDDIRCFDGASPPADLGFKFIVEPLRNRSKMSSVDKIVFSQLLGPGGKLQDVNFVIMDKNGDIQGELKAHKLILSLVSEVFETQFYGPFAESNKQAGNL